VSISFSEIVVVFLVALLLFGPEQLPKIARQMGKLAGDLRKATDSVKREWYNAVYPPAEEIRRDFATQGRELRALKAEVLAPPEGSQGTPTRNSSEQAKTEGPTNEAKS
jgi:sec-independent protein translocase protein TatB